jgi:hypothetical protein
MSRQDDQSRGEDRARLVSQARNRLENAAARFDPQVSEAVLEAVKATLHKPIPPHGFTVMQALGDQIRARVFNENSQEVFHELQSQFVEAITEEVTHRGGQPRRKARRIAENAWSWNEAADRRTRAAHKSPYRGRPEVYNPEVVKAVADAIAHSVGEERFRWYHGEKTTAITNSAQASRMVDLVCCAVEWVTFVAWQLSAPPGTTAPKLRPEGILSILRKVTAPQRAKRTD